MNDQTPQADNSQGLDESWLRYYANERANELASLRRIMDNDLHSVTGYVTQSGQTIVYGAGLGGLVVRYDGTPHLSVLAPAARARNFLAPAFAALRVDHVPPLAAHLERAAPRIDLLDIAALQRACADATAALGLIDVLVNNAANDDRHDWRDMTVAYWDDRINTNLKGHIITVEDPIEYQLGGITQVQVNTKTGLTFPKVLRSVLHGLDFPSIGIRSIQEFADLLQ